MALAGKGTHLRIKADFKRTLNHKYTFRPAEQHLTWRLQRSDIREDRDSFLGTKGFHPAGETALHAQYPRGKGKGGIGLWSWGIWCWHLFLGTGEFTPRAAVDKYLDPWGEPL